MRRAPVLRMAGPAMASARTAEQRQGPNPYETCLVENARREIRARACKLWRHPVSNHAPTAKGPKTAIVKTRADEFEGFSSIRGWMMPFQQEAAAGCARCCCPSHRGSIDISCYRIRPRWRCKQRS